MGGEDSFLDDDLDDIPDNALQELEWNAFSSTQHPNHAPAQQARPQPRTPLYGNAPLNRAGTQSKNLTWRPPQPRRRELVEPPTNPPASAPEPPSSDYGFDDEDVVDLDEPAIAARAVSGPPSSRSVTLRPSAGAESLYRRNTVLDPETEAAYAAADAELGTHHSGEWAHAAHLQPQTNNDADVSPLHARIAELEAEQARLRQSEQEARNAAMAKQGEIAIVRANQDKAAKEYERRIESLRKLHADESAKQKAELEAGKKERERMQTDNRFLQHDLAQETDRAKRLNGPGKVRGAVVSREETHTPRKAKRTGFGDGFDDDEVSVVSPSKSKDRQKDQTPRHAAKRKRTANDSPIAALSFTQPQGLVRQESDDLAQASTRSGDAWTAAKVDRFEFVGRMLSHSPYEGHEPTVEALAKHKFPSQPTRSLSFMLITWLARPAKSVEAEYLPLKLTHVLLELWTRCLAEQLYSPLYLILDLIHFALYLELSPVISQLIEEAVPLCIKSIHLVAVPRGRASINPASVAGVDRVALDRLGEEVDVDELMDLLLRLCQAATLVPGRREIFWQHMDLHFTLLMLNKAQPIGQIQTALQILATSTLPSSFGPVCRNAEEQTRRETGVTDRLTSLLFEMPEAPHDEPAYSEAEIAELRLETLKVLRALCLTDHGGLLLAHNIHAIGRLVRFLNGQVDKLYSIPPLPTSRAVKTDGDDVPTAHSLVAQTVGMVTRLIYHLLRTYGDKIDLVQKLDVVHGGYHKFLISMTRVAFTEQLVLEQGIEDEVAEAAHAILDNALSPEEGEAIAKALETPKGSKGSDLARSTISEKKTGDDAAIVDGDAAMSDPG